MKNHRQIVEQIKGNGPGIHDHSELNIDSIKSPILEQTETEDQKKCREDSDTEQNKLHREGCNDRFESIKDGGQIVNERKQTQF